MKKIIISIAVLGVLIWAMPALAAKPDTPPGQESAEVCATIKDGTIEYGRVGDPDTNIIPIGYDMWGYNYQAHMFNGYYDNNSRPDTPVSEGIMLQMKWNDEWLSNKDCNGDGKLDRGYSCDPVLAKNSGCPGAWLTNHQRGTYEENGVVHHWEYFVKIIAVPTDAEKMDGVWYAADGTEIGPEIWGAYAVIERVYNDTGTGEHGVEYLSPNHAGFGGW